VLILNEATSPVLETGHDLGPASHACLYLGEHANHPCAYWEPAVTSRDAPDRACHSRPSECCTYLPGLLICRHMDLNRTLTQRRREITVRGMFVTTTTQRSSPQAESTAMAISNAPVSLDDVDTILSNLEGLCSEEQSWATADVGLEQCIQVSYHYCSQHDAATLVMVVLLTQLILQHEHPSPGVLAILNCPTSWLLVLLSELLHSGSPLCSSRGMPLIWRSIHQDVLGVHLHLNTLFPPVYHWYGCWNKALTTFLLHAGSLEWRCRKQGGHATSQS